MIMKKFILMIMLMFIGYGAFAQTAIETPKILDNVYVGIGGQISTPLDFNGVFPLNSGVAVTLGKEITPVFGFNVEDNVWFGSHANGTHSVPHFDNPPSHNAIRGNYLGINGTINLSNLFLGYAGKPRAFELQTITGLGWWHVFTPNASDRMRDDLAAKTGLNFLFNLGQAHTIYVQPAVLWNLESPGSNHDNIAFNKMGAQLAVQVGYVYHFKTSNGTHSFKTYDVGAMNDEINRLQAELSKKPTEITKEIIRERIVNVAAENTVWVPFAFDKANLTDEAKSTLDNFKNANAVNVDGYASWEDGSNAEHNKALSIARAQAVTNYLEGLGVKVNQTEGHGATSATSQRCVIVTLVK